MAKASRALLPLLSTAEAWHPGDACAYRVGQHARSAAHDALRPLLGQCCASAFTDQPALMLRERCEHRRHKLTGWRGRISGRVEREQVPALALARPA